MSRQFSRNFILEIQKGNIPGHRIWTSLGEFENGTIATRGEDCYRFADLSPEGPALMPSPSLAGEQLTVVSSSNADNGATATGALTIKIHYLDVAGDEQTEIVTMNGTTNVDTVATDIIFVNDFYVLTVGSNGVAEGNIVIYKKGSTYPDTLYNVVIMGGNESLVPSRMCPAGHTMYISHWHAAEVQVRRSFFRLRSTSKEGVLTPGVFLFKGVAPLRANPSGTIEMDYEPIPPFAIVKVSHWDDAPAAEGGVQITFVVVEDGY